MFVTARQSSEEFPSILPLVELIHHAVGNTELWPIVLSKIADAAKSEQITITARVDDKPMSSLPLSQSAVNQPFQLSISFTPALLGNSSQPAERVFMSSLAQRPDAGFHVLRHRYGLTPTECRLAHLLCQGLKVSEASKQMGITLETARYHLKRVMAKTSTHRQAELVRLMLSLPVT